MAQLTLGTGDASAQTRERRGRREFSFNEPNTRPANLVDKRGMYEVVVAGSTIMYYSTII